MTGSNDDERICAWIDNMLDDEETQEMTRLVANDDALAARAARLQHLDALVRAAVPEEAALPPALLDRLGLGRPDGAGASVIHLKEVRAANDAAAKRPAGRVAGHRAWRIAAQLALVGALGVALAVWQAPGDRADRAQFRTLSDAARPSGPVNAIVMFAPGVDADTARTIAKGAGVSLIGKPNEAGMWKLSVPMGRRAAVLEMLRSNAKVSLAEPVDAKEP